MGTIFRSGNFSRAFAALAVTLAALSASAWDLDEPVVAFWSGPGTGAGNRKLSDETFKELKNCGFNTVWAYTPASLDLAAKWGMRAICNLWLPRKRSMTPAERTNVLAHVASVKDHPALLCYYHCDEPRAEWFEALSADSAVIRAADPKHPTWVNLLPTYASNKQLGIPGNITAAYWEHVRRFMDVYDPEIISHDHYQFCTGWDNNDYFLNLALMQQASAARGIPFVNGVQACTWVPGEAASPSSPRIPGPDEMRYLVYTTLAYGAQGIYYYVYSRTGHRGSIASLDGVPDAKYHELKKVNPIFVATAKETRGYRLTGSFFKGVCPRGGTPYGSRALLSFADGGASWAQKAKEPMTNSVLVARFDAPKRNTRLMVVNLDYRKGASYAISAPAPVARFDPDSKSYRPLGEKFTLDLVGGEGALLEMGN